MKKTLGLAFLILAFCANLLSAQETKNEERSPLSVYLTTDVAYYPESKTKIGRSGTHFAQKVGTEWFFQRLIFSWNHKF